MNEKEQIDINGEIKEQIKKLYTDSLSENFNIKDSVYSFINWINGLNSRNFVGNSAVI